MSLFGPTTEDKRRQLLYLVHISSTYYFVNEDVEEDNLNNDFIAIEPVGEASKRAEVAYSMSTKYLISN